LLTAEPSRAHVDVQPRLVEQGNVTDLVIELPLLRPGAPPERLEVEGPGIDMLSSDLAAVAGTETRWNVRLRADSPTGSAPIILRAHYPGGESVEVSEELTVVPADETGSFPWIGVVAGVLLAAALTAFSLRVLRRMTW
jgi:hypothetical protein